MKTTLLLTALLTLAALAALPTASANTIDPVFPECQTVYDFPDLGWEVCVDPYDAGCTVYEYRTTIVGREKTCIYPAPSAAASSSVGTPWPGGQTPDVQCMDYYSATQVPGTRYWVVRRDSCSAQLYECPAGSVPPAPPCHEASILQTSSATAQPQCLQMYRETDLGLVRIVSRDSCHTDHYLCGQEKADLLADGFDATQCDAGLSTASTPAPPLQRTCYTQGQGELQSRTCVDPTSTDCTLYRQQTTGVGSSWVCYPSGESGSDY